MGRPFRPLPAVTLARRRALLAGLPVMLVGGAYAAWRGGGMGHGREHPPPPPPTLATAPVEGIVISNDVGGNFPVPNSAPGAGQAQGFGRADDAAPVYALHADAAMSQAVITRQGSGSAARHVLNLSIGSPASINAAAVVAAMMLRLDLGATLPTSPRSYRLDSAHLLGDALVVATRMPGVVSNAVSGAIAAAAPTSRQVFRITGGTIMVGAATSGETMAAQIHLHAVTAVAAGGTVSPATGRIRLHSITSISVPLVLEQAV